MLRQNNTKEIQLFGKRKVIEFVHAKAGNDKPPKTRKRKTDQGEKTEKPKKATK